MVDFEGAREAVGQDMILCGNLDPVNSIQNLSPDSLKKEANNLIRKQKGSMFIFSGGCEITPETPIENIHVLRDCSYNIF